MNRLTQVNIGSAFGSPFSTGGKNIGNLVSLFLDVAFSVAGIILLILILGAGISIIAGAGSGKTDQVEKGKKTIVSALTGFIIVGFAYFIVQLIETVFFNQPGLFTGF